MFRRKKAEKGVSQYTCAWCEQKIPEASEIFSVNARFGPEINLAEFAGEIWPFTLTHSDKTVSAIVTAPDSPAKKAGYDLFFIVCSEFCGLMLRHELEKETDTFEQVE